MPRAPLLRSRSSASLGLVLSVVALSLGALAGCKRDPGDGGAERSAAAAPDTAAAVAPSGAAAPKAQPGVLLGPRVEALSGEDWNAGQIEWLSFDAGLAQAKAEKKPICLVFWASWCGHCKIYSHVFEDARVVEKARRFVMVRANVDENEEIAQRYAPDGTYVPRTLFLSPEGVVAKDVHAARSQYVHFYDERDPSSLLGGMDAALQKLAK